MILWVDWALLGISFISSGFSHSNGHLLAWPDGITQDCSLIWLLAGCSTGIVEWNVPALSRWPLSGAWASHSMVAEFHERVLHICGNRDCSVLRPSFRNYEHHFYYILLDRASHRPALIQEGKLTSVFDGSKDNEYEVINPQHMGIEKYVCAIGKMREQTQWHLATVIQLWFHRRGSVRPWHLGVGMPRELDPLSPEDLSISEKRLK